MEAPVNHLQAELERIEADASKHSQLIIAAADALNAAHELCQMINATAVLSQPVTPFVGYHTQPDRCEIAIFGARNSVEILQALMYELKIEIVFSRPFGTEGDLRFVFPKYPGVSLIVQGDPAAVFIHNHMTAVAA